MYASILSNPIRRMLKFYGISRMNSLDQRERQSFIDEVHDKAVDLIWKEYGRKPICGEAEEILQEWLEQEDNFDPEY